MKPFHSWLGDLTEELTSKDDKSLSTLLNKGWAHYTADIAVSPHSSWSVWYYLKCCGLDGDNFKLLSDQAREELSKCMLVSDWSKWWDNYCRPHINVLQENK